MATTVAKSMIDRHIEGSIITISSQAGVVGGAAARSLLWRPRARSATSRARLQSSGRRTRSRSTPWRLRSRARRCWKRRLKNPDFRKNLERVPMGRIAEPEEIAGAVSLSGVARRAHGHRPGLVRGRRVYRVLMRGDWRESGLVALSTTSEETSKKGKQYGSQNACWCDRRRRYQPQPRGAVISTAGAMTSSHWQTSMRARWPIWTRASVCRRTTIRMPAPCWKRKSSTSSRCAPGTAGTRPGPSPPPRSSRKRSCVRSRWPTPIGRAEEMLVACKRNDVKLVIGHQRRFLPAYTLAKESDRARGHRPGADDRQLRRRRPAQLQLAPDRYVPLSAERRRVCVGDGQRRAQDRSV